MKGTIILGMDLYQMIVCFVVYSMLGWLVESIYMSFCNKRITNRGFGTLPFCPIYGFGALGGYIVLYPFGKNLVLLYIAGAVIATTFEFLVAKLTLKIFNLVWWDYNEKPFNYKGIICLESTLAWGVYAIIVVRFLHKFTLEQLDRIPRSFGIVFCSVVLGMYAVDFIYHVVKALKDKTAVNAVPLKRKELNNEAE